MALTPEQIKAIEEAKKKGLTREQALAKVFLARTPVIRETRFGDVGEDIVSAGKGVWSDIRGRGSNIIQSAGATLKNEQTPFETTGQILGNVIGGAGDIAFRGVQAATTPFLRESEERSIERGVTSALEATGIPQRIAESSPRTQRNIIGGFGLLEGVTAGVGTSLTKPVTSRLSSMVNRLRGGATRVTPTAAPTPAPAVPTSALPTAPSRATPTFGIPQAAAPTRVTTATPTRIPAERITTNLESKLRQQANDPNLTPRQQQAAAEASLTFREKMIGLRPDEKKRLEEMGEQKIGQYLDATFLRNVSDSPTPNNVLPEGVWGPQELGNFNVEKAFRDLETQLNDVGSEIGATRRKLGTVQLQQPQVKVIETAFSKQIDELGLTVRNGQIVQQPNRISPTAGADINALQNLYDDLLTFKQSPTITNAYDLRANFDRKIKFGKSAREVSDAVDPISRSVRKAIAQEAAKVIGKSNAAELQKYSDFMDAYSDMKSYVDRSAGSEFLLRRSLSGLGREQRALLDIIKQYTGQDLMNDATAMKIAIDRFANDSQKNLFQQEITRAGLDVATVMSGDAVGIGQVALRKLVEYGIDEEAVIRAAAAGLGGYILLTYTDDEGLIAPAGLAVLSAMPQGARAQALKQANAIKPLKLSDEMADDVTKALNLEDPLERVINAGDEIDADDVARLDALKKTSQTKALTNDELIEAKAIMEKYGDIFPGGKGKGAIPQTTDLTAQAAKLKAEGKTFEEFVDSQIGMPDYAMSHRPTVGVRSFNLTETVDGEQMIPKDMYTQWYGSRGTKEDLESIAVLKRIKGNPDAEVTIYRASPSEKFNYGDWVSFSKSYAQQHAEGNGTKVHSMKVKAKDVRWAMDDVNEFGYFPDEMRQKYQKIWDMANTSINPKDYKTADAYIEAMYKKGHFDSIEGSKARYNEEMELQSIWDNAK